MEILAKGKKNGRSFVIGRGTYDEVKALNVEKDFNSALDTLIQIKKNHNYIFGTKEGYRVKRQIYGTRKAI